MERKKYDSLILEFDSKELMEMKSFGLINLCNINKKYDDVFVIKLSETEIQLIGETELINDMKDKVLNNII